MAGEQDRRILKAAATSKRGKSAHGAAGAAGAKDAKTFQAGVGGQADAASLLLEGLLLKVGAGDARAVAWVLVRAGCTCACQARRAALPLAALARAASPLPRRTRARPTSHHSNATSHHSVQTDDETRALCRELVQAGRLAAVQKALNNRIGSSYSGQMGAVGCWVLGLGAGQCQCWVLLAGAGQCQRCCMLACLHCLARQC